MREIRSRQKAKRRGMKAISLFKSPFPEDIEIDYHHINSILTLPLPKRIHNLCSSNDTNYHREKCDYWITYLYGLDVKKLFSP